MSVSRLADYKKNLAPGKPCQISFYGHSYQVAGDNKALNLDVVVADGDYIAVFDFVIEQGGIGEIGGDGIYYFLPWPCAAVEIKPLEGKNN